eukprot:6209325-Karenia_brevis.AAC.1
MSTPRPSSYSNNVRLIGMKNRGSTTIPSMPCNRNWTPWKTSSPWQQHECRQWKPRLPPTLST